MVENETLVEKLNEHDEIIKQHDSLLRVHTEQIRNIENGNLKLENLVMQENRETRATIMQTNRELHDLINNILGFKTGQNQLNHNMKMSTAESVVKIVGILAGSGGLLYYIFS